MKLSVMSMMFLFACAASNGGSDAPVQPASDKPWQIAMTSSGGFAGRGAGNYAIDSTGKIEVTTMNGRTCSFQASEAETRRFRELLTTSQPATWKPSYSPTNRCCDRIEYVLNVEHAGKTHTTEWIDDPEPMPAGLTGLWMALVGGGGESLRNTYERQCSQR